MLNSNLSKTSVCVFDAYGTLFDVSSVARGAQNLLGDQWQALSDIWRTKQLQYTWLRSLTGQHTDFWQVTKDALDFAMDSLKIGDENTHHHLMNLYLSISAFPEVAETLSTLKKRGIRLAILSNGSPKMLQAATSNAGIGDLFEAILSVEEVGVFKPHPSVYQLVPDRLKVRKEQVCFMSSNSWDAWSAKSFGFNVLWCNRFGQVAERIPGTPDGEIGDLSRLPDMIG